MNELKIDKSLLVNNFDTYKLSLEKFRISKEDVPGEVGIKYPNERQFSFIHHKEFSLHNHLYNDSWNDNQVYLVTSNRKVKKAQINSQTDKLFGLVDVWEIPANSSTSCNFNVSLKFPSADTAVITDGKGSLYIIDTSNRAELHQWKTLHCEKVFEEESEFRVICSLSENSPNRRVHCILLLIENSNTVESSGHNQASGFETILKWLVFTEGAEGIWEKNVLNEFKGQGSVDYICFESGCKALYLISDKEFKSPLVEKEEEKAMEQQNGEAVNADYQWQQSSDEITLWINNTSASDKSDFKIDSTFNSINISFKDNSLLSGTLFHRIDPQLTTWSFDNSKLEVVMQKEESGRGWPQLVTDCDKIGTEIINEQFVADVHEKLKHLCSENEEQGGAAMLSSGELEECDAFGENRILRRYGITGQVTHKILLGSDQWLFSLSNVCDSLPAFCMRRDVDGIVWQPVQPHEDSTIFQCTHLHTFPAFGYIAASKQEKKFLLSPPNLSYVAVVNSVGHVILFRKTDMHEGSVLRNRKTHQTTSCLYIQNLINLESNNHIYGAVATNKYLFVLTTKQLIMININDS